MRGSGRSVDRAILEMFKDSCIELRCSMKGFDIFKASKYMPACPGSPRVGSTMIRTFFGRPEDWVFCGQETGIRSARSSSGSSRGRWPLPMTSTKRNDRTTLMVHAIQSGHTGPMAKGRIRRPRISSTIAKLWNQSLNACPSCDVSTGRQH
ncbi:hypothetical protein K437DRAFT_136615 [Tilletiaria anomala UBC 951]|uniref:Uncharacterized protein n=1 Tax=Tilletiaria anomala (strain ATCC 24038 / CBS 436.72 / UBC 951) TaxID=1037660 RepID=A0A066VS51_TILAU|nr:uncharacterized protein K437DRAFT_136615 [Tilletiaria anomala UBC 951]KDN44557.1 hypothetical protein K437DRAFT_136615 [Tilletiaria anomala UBC 951]